MDKFCERDIDGLYPVDECYQDYTAWMIETGRTAKSSKENFGKALAAIEVYRTRPRIEGKRIPCYSGIRKKGTFLLPDSEDQNAYTESTPAAAAGSHQKELV